jgi:hypothetical protein
MVHAAAHGAGDGAAGVGMRHHVGLGGLGFGHDGADFISLWCCR